MRIKQHGPESHNAASGTVYSFDVFDTCVTRMYAYPRDLFYELGLRVAPASLAANERQRFAARFQSLRIRAEKKAHRHAWPRQTVTIDEIYGYFSCPNDLSAKKPDLIKAELDLERESIYPIPAVVSHLDRLRQSGQRIIFISDMYLPSSLLAPILKEHGVMREGDALYVSCDVGITKHHGELFQHVLNTEQLDASQLIHVGDNPHADIAMAGKANIKASLAYGGMLTHRESVMAGHRLPRQRDKSFLAALSRRLRLMKAAPASPNDATMDHVVHGIVVPFLLAYVSWILDHAKHHGIQRLYFVARDAEIMLRIAESLQGGAGPIELRYLYGSRRAWLAPSITPGSDDWSRMLVVSGQASSRHDITAKMGLDAAAQETLIQQLSCSTEEWSRQLSHREAIGFLADLMGNASTSALITSWVARLRKATQAYFWQEGLFDKTPWALVDAGWSLNSQAALKRILDADETAHQSPKGYYLALARDHLGLAQAGVAYPFVPQAGSIFSRRRVIIEHCFLPATHATTSGYLMHGSRIEPVFGHEFRGKNELGYATFLQGEAVNAAHLVSTDPMLAAALKEHVSEILSNAKALLQHPKEADARALASFGTVADMRHESAFVEPLCRSLELRDVWTVVCMALSKKKNFKSPSFMWLEGSITLSPWYVRAPLRWLLVLDALRNRLKG